MDIEQTYQHILEQLHADFGVVYREKGEGVCEISEEGIILFRLLHAKAFKPEDDRIIISFHLDILAVDAIQWYLRIKQYHEELFLTQSYYEDDFGNTFLGPQAEMLKQYKDEQFILSNWAGSKDEAKAYANQKLKGATDTEDLKVKPPIQTVAFIDREQAIKYFKDIKISDDEDPQ